MSERDAPRRSFTAEYGIGEVVYQRVRVDKVPGLVVGVSFYPDFSTYHVCWGDGHNNHSTHYALELAREYVPDYERG